MALVKYGSIVDEIKGSIAGHTFQGGRNSGIVKTKNKRSRKTMSNSSERRKRQLGLFQIVTAHWSTLNTRDRDSWSDLLGIWTFTNKFGEVYNGTAFQIFTAVNLNRLFVELPMLDSAPVYEAATSISFSDLTFDSEGNFDISVEGGAPTGQLLLIYMSPLYHQSFPPSKVNYAAILSSIYTGAVSFNAFPLWSQYFGQNPQPGNVVYLKKVQFWPDYPQHQFELIERIIIS